MTSLRAPNILDLPAGGLPSDYPPVPAPRLGKAHNLTYGGSQSATATAIGPWGATTYMIEISMPSSGVGTGMRWVYGNQAATFPTSFYRVPMGAIVYYMVTPGDSITVISDDTNTNTVVVTECLARQVDP